MIIVKDLHKSFEDNQVLKGVSYHIHPGEKIVVVGPSGSGKSTFLRCLNLLERPTSGEIWFDGQNITDPKIDINKVRQHMGMVFQHFNLFNNLTIMNNITLAPVKLKLMGEEEAKENALKLLKRVGLEEKADAYPASLSGGQKQRIAIVRSLAMNPRVMLFDEPTSALDPEMGRRSSGSYEGTGGERYDNGGRNARNGICQRSRYKSAFHGWRKYCGGEYSSGIFHQSAESQITGIFIQGIIRCYKGTVNADDHNFFMHDREK